ncbi:MAG: hypothetical protein ACLS6G_13625 [Christensenellales bacterium]
MPKKKQVFEPENLESIRSAISGLIVEPPETIEPVVYSVDLLSRHDPYYPMVQGEATSRLAMTATRNMAINPITGDAVIEDEGFRAFFEGYDGLKIGLTVGAQKLLSTAALYLTQNNHYRPEESARIETRCNSADSYARLLGYPSMLGDGHAGGGRKEKRRIKNLMKDVREDQRPARRALQPVALLVGKEGARLGLSGRAPAPAQRRQARDDLHSVQRRHRAVSALLVCDAVPRGAAEHRRAQPARLPRRLQAGISQLRAPQHGARHRRYHFRFGAAGCVRRHPDFDEVQKTDRGHWENRIKTPLETALDSCVRAGVLDGWEYCGAKKAKLSDSEVDIGDYATFIGLYVRFRMGRMNDED